MLIPLPNLDDRRWEDLVDQGRALIPFHAPEWTDHNLHDPGMTFTELLAWMTEAQIYRINRITEGHRRKFLRLVGISPGVPRPARAVLRLALQPDSPPLTIPAGLEFAGCDPFDVPTRFRLPTDVVAVAGVIEVVRRWSGETWHDLTGQWLRNEPFAPFGDDPRPGAALYLGLSRSLPVGTAATIAITVDDLSASDDERSRIVEEMRAGAACQGPPGRDSCEPASEAPGEPSRQITLRHHAARVVWEFSPAPGDWQPLDPQRDEILDETRGLSLNGAVRICLPAAMIATSQRNDTARPYLRCRFAAGAFDAPPTLRDISLNGWQVEQAVPVADDTVPQANWLSWEIAWDAEIHGDASPGDEVALSLRLDAKNRIDRLDLAPAGPRWRILDYRRPTGGPGFLAIEGEQLDWGKGFANQRVELAQRPLLASSLRLYTLEHGLWRRWRERPDFDASTPRDSHFRSDAQQGVIIFGDGWRGRVPPAGAPIVAQYLTTRAAAGDLGAGAINSVAETRHNAGLLGRVDPSTDISYGTALSQFLKGVTNPLPATGGADAESLGAAEARALAAIGDSERAVTAVDIEEQARATPGVRLARVSAWPNFSAAFPCLSTPGVVTVIVLPYLPRGRPTPSRGLRYAVAAHLRRRRVLGTRIDVVGPSYTKVGVRARLAALPGIDPTEVRQRAIEAVTRFFDPLHGGPEGAGWPFGRDVYRYEVLQALDETEGVSHVLSLELVAEDAEPTCSHVCIGPIGLVATGDLRVEVV